MNAQLRLWDDDPVLHNVFFGTRAAAAVVPITRAGQDLVRSQRLVAKLLPPERLHVSLCAVGGFSGACPPAVINAAKAVADTVSMDPFTVSFDRVASFAGGNGRRALVLTGGEGVAGLVQFQKTLGLTLNKAGLGLRQKDRFTPHVTMMYADHMCDFPIEPISWTVDEFVLVDSLWGQSRHVQLGRWPL
ncbi:MAG: 2'-5' RNA ligase family protein [Hyphomicrobium sp.]